MKTIEVKQYDISLGLGSIGVVAKGRDRRKWERHGTYWSTSI